MNKVLLSSLFAGLFSVAQAADAPKVQSLDELLQTVKKAEGVESRANKQRYQRFLSQKNQQQRLLNEANAELARERTRSEQLKAQFDTNEASLAEMENQLNIKLGNLGEAVGVLRKEAADTSAKISSSIISSQLPNRSGYLDDLAQRKEIPQIPELRRLWAEMQTEMTEQGKIVRYDTEIVDSKGVKVNATVDRIGVFNLVSNGDYLKFNKDSQNVEQIATQPNSGEFSAGISDFQNSGQMSLVAIDPTKGTIVEIETGRESWPDRVKNYAGVVGFSIIGVLIIGFVIALERLITLGAIGGKMRKQAGNLNPGNNPLGRIMAVYLANKDDDVENLELKLDEAVLKELPRLETRVAIIKIFAAVSPLMGLLGTVTGMIETFQGITLYGSGDPGVMAAGISSALITTVLGIVAAIPLILIHSVVSAKSKSLVHLLEEQSAGLIAQHTENQGS
ncbi:MotA/TolQ/ExbB proton channel family protein [Pleionea sp. CnH1-48]|uniref:MotA/TolQ/ExbB proton channel family protein n=1 Tax=Pleionea sp. CnH1-48 TaxID=2954494 RepID=UPI0020972128|nr:MotA/TolQ/ExbB proton channel family protein [Pleionea sp. CnH1-48]MCO7225441.1 MotA/TolQ/ExbB proton channel family protein [Pleionea sp. CnH1-48]